MLKVEEGGFLCPGFDCSATAMTPDLQWFLSMTPGIGIIPAVSMLAHSGADPVVCEGQPSIEHHSMGMGKVEM
jgi:hypothetical protein